MTEKKTNLNHNKDITFLVVSCDAFKDIWSPFFHCFFKYWPDCPYPIYLGSNKTEFNDERVKSILIGDDKDYSANLLAMLNNIKTPWLILWIEDALITAPVDNAKILELISVAQKANAGYLKLNANTPWFFSKNKTQIMGQIPQGVKYRVGIGLSLWKKETLLEVLRPGESAWQIEREGSKRTSAINASFFALSTNLRANPPFKIINAVIKGKWGLDALQFLKREGFNYIIPSRSNQPLWHYIYSKIYLLRLDIYRILRKYWYE